MKTPHQTSGHTLTEMLIVLSMISVLVTMSIKMLEQMKEENPQEQAQQVAEAADQYALALAALRSQLQTTALGKEAGTASAQ